MSTRNRAWRRRKTHFILAKMKATKEWVIKTLTIQAPEGVKAERPHRQGKLTRVQALRQHFELSQELVDEL